MGTGSFPGLKKPERGVDHQPNLAPKVRMGWNYAFPSCLYLYRHVMGWLLSLLFLLSKSCQKFWSVSLHAAAASCAVHGETDRQTDRQSVLRLAVSCFSV